MTRKVENPPMIGEAFNPEQMNLGESFTAMADELDYYLPHDHASIKADLLKAGYAYERAGTAEELNDDADAFQIGVDATNAAEDVLTEWAQSVERHDYIYFTLDGWFAGFRINVDSALEDADWSYSCDGSREHGNSHQPGDGAGLEVFVNDHGNVTAWIYGANGHRREIFAVV